MRVLSIFIQVRGGASGAVSEGLQSRWQAQWLNNNTQPIPKGFTASLILWSEMIHMVLLQPGFANSKWTASNISPPNEACNKVQARSSEKWTVEAQDYKYHATSNFHVDGFDLPLKDFPMELEIRQDDAYGSPTAYVFWSIKQRVHYRATGKALGLIDNTVWAEGHVDTLYRLCDPTNYENARKMDLKIGLNDEAFTLDLQLKTDQFRMDQKEDNDIDFETWQKGMHGLWTKAPQVSLSSIGLGFLRTTNLLMPGKEVIDFNEGIGLKVPKDFVLVGDILKA